MLGNTLNRNALHAREAKLMHQLTKKEMTFELSSTRIHASVYCCSAPAWTCKSPKWLAFSDRIEQGTPPLYAGRVLYSKTLFVHRVICTAVVQMDCQVGLFSVCDLCKSVFDSKYIWSYPLDWPLAANLISGHTLYWTAVALYCFTVYTPSTLRTCLDVTTFINGSI